VGAPMTREAAVGPPMTREAAVLSLQRVAGNRAVTRVLLQRALLPGLATGTSVYDRDGHEWVIETAGQRTNFGVTPNRTEWQYRVTDGKSTKTVWASTDSFFPTAAGAAEAGAVSAAQAAQASVEAARPPINKTGAFRVFGDGDPYSQNDVEFERILGLADAARRQRGGPPVAIAVLDTGVHAESDYLRARTRAHADVTGPTPAYDVPFAPRDPAHFDAHGSKVAAQAGFGTERIALIDVRVQVGFMASGDRSAQIAEAIRWAVHRHGARVVTCSIIVNWGSPELRAVVSEFSDRVLFLMTAGNSDTRFTQRAVDEGGKKGNALLVGGVDMSGRRHPKRGAGPAVDLTVPSGDYASSAELKSVPVHYPLASARLKGDLDAAGEQRLGANPGASMVATETGVSFGVPLVANVVAKMLLINPALTIAEIEHILVNEAVQSRGGAREELSRSHGVLDPVAAYEAALRRVPEIASPRAGAGAGTVVREGAGGV